MAPGVQNALKFGQCMNPSKIRPGNAKPFDSLLGMLGSTPVMRIQSLLSKMPSLQHREEAPDIMIKLESTNPGAQAAHLLVNRATCSLACAAAADARTAQPRLVSHGTQLSQSTQRIPIQRLQPLRSRVAQLWIALRVAIRKPTYASPSHKDRRHGCSSRC